MDDRCDQAPWMDSNADVNLTTVHCRTGSLENAAGTCCAFGSVHCRTGSLENLQFSWP